jgi:hypothetical protein
VSADLDPGPVVRVPARRRTSARLSAASGLAAVLAGVLVLVLALELRIRGLGWLPWIVLALAPATAGLLCLSRGKRASYMPGVVFGSCTAVIGVTVPVGLYRDGAVIAIIAMLAVAAGIAAVAATLALRAAYGRLFTRTPRLRSWCAAAVVVTAASIPSPAYLPPGPIGTVFTGGTGSQNVVVAIGLLLAALPLVAAGLVPRRTSAALAAGWLPVAVAQLIAGPVIQTAPARLDAWYFVSWLPWLAVAALAVSASGLLKPNSVGRSQPPQERQRGEDDQQ